MTLLGAIPHLPELAMFAGQAFLALFLLTWAMYTIFVMTFILLEHGAITFREAVPIAFRELPFAMCLAALLIVGPALVELMDGIDSAREAIRW